MKLVTFEKDGTTRIGAFKTFAGEQVIVDLNRLEPRLPTDMMAFLQAGHSARALAEAALVNAARGEGLELAALKLKAPIPRPGKIICVGLNYRDHAEESKMAIPDVPTIFTKFANSVLGPGEAIVIPRVTDKIDYEGELAFVIGRRARHVAAHEAQEVVAGYMAFNDVSARDFQFRTSQWTIGKTFDTFAPMGPALVTVDEVPDPHHLDLRVTVNGEVRQSSNTRNLIFSIPDLVAYLSQGMTLEPGDLVATGTPAGVGYARNPPRFLQPGDRVEVEIEAIGTLANPVIAEV